VFNFEGKEWLFLKFNGAHFSNNWGPVTNDFEISTARYLEVESVEWD